MPVVFVQAIRRMFPFVFTCMEYIYFMFGLFSLSFQEISEKGYSILSM